MIKHKTNIPKWLRVIIPSVLIVVWFALGAVGGPYFGKISDVASNDQATFLPAGAESTQVNKELKKFQDDSAIPAIIVFTDKDKKLPINASDKIKEVIAQTATISGVLDRTSPPVLSEDGKAALVVINIASDADYKEVIPDIKNKLDKSGLAYEYKISGPAGFLNDLAGAFSGIDGLLLGVALAVVFVILLIVYRSPVLPFIVLLNSIFALCAAILLVYYLAKYNVVTLNGQVQGILFILVIGAATDYALLYVARYREELKKHKETYRAILASWKHSFEPIVAAGGTVIAGLLCLLLSDLNSNKALGPVGAIGILVAVIATLTLLPSLLLMWGRKVFWPRVPQYGLLKNVEATVKKRSIWLKVADFIRKYPRRIWVTTTIALVICAVGVTYLKADGVSQSDLILGVSDARDGQKIIDDHFPGGSGTPVQIVVSANKAEEIVKVLDADPGVASVAAIANNSPSGTVPLGEEADRIKDKIRDSAQVSLDAQKTKIRQQIESSMFGVPTMLIEEAYQSAVMNLPSTNAVISNAYPFRDASPKSIDGEVLLQATLADSANSNEAQLSIVRLRNSLHEIDSQSRIGGITAVQLDTKNSSERDRAVVIPSVLVVITVILMLLLRSVLAPLILLITTMLSFAAILGVSAIVFNNVLHFPGADPSVVLYGFIFLVALGIDYNIFLMTRVREESLKKGTRKGIAIGLVATGSVITSAGIVLAATFAALAVIPILFLVQLAFIVALGVLLDTVIVRSLLVPAIAHDLGGRIWWPSKKHKD